MILNPNVCPHFLLLSIILPVALSKEGVCPVVHTKSGTFTKPNSVVAVTVLKTSEQALSTQLYKVRCM